MSRRPSPSTSHAANLRASGDPSCRTITA
jgi:hypothetical protein